MNLFGKLALPRWTRHYVWDIPITLIVGLLVAMFVGPAFIGPFIILAIMEISLSFDNAVVNAKVLERLSKGWHKAFLYVGIWIAVLGMRLVFPILIVALTAGLGFGQVVDLALNDTAGYAHHLELAHPEIAALGGVYLGMIALTWLLDEHDTYWFGPVERLLAKVGNSVVVSAATMVITLLIISHTVGGEIGGKILFSGVVSLALFLTVSFISELFERHDEHVEEGKTGKAVKYGVAGLGLFIYLEIQDMAFSFDGVSGAFAITDHIIVIAAGLGIGALFVRSMTIHLVEDGHLESFPFLENGAHWAIGVLAVCILGSIFVPIPELLTGGAGAVLIIASVISSVRKNRAEAREAVSA